MSSTLPFPWPRCRSRGTPRSWRRAPRLCLCARARSSRWGCGDSKMFLGEKQGRLACAIRSLLPPSGSVGGCASSAYATRSRCWVHRCARCASRAAGRASCRCTAGRCRAALAGHRGVQAAAQRDSPWEGGGGWRASFHPRFGVRPSVVVVGIGLEAFCRAATDLIGALHHLGGSRATPPCY